MAAAATARKPAAKRTASKAGAATQRAQRNARALERARNGHRSAAATARNGHTAAAAAPARTAPATPRRKSGPAVRRPAPKRSVTVARPLARVAQGGAAVVLDRVLRGRAWVGLIGALLAGIVFLNVSVLELNRGIASTSAKSAALERSNSSIRARVADLGSTERIQRLAEARGYVLPQPGDVTYLRPHASDARKAASQIEQPTAEPSTSTPPTVEPASDAAPTSAAPATTPPSAVPAAPASAPASASVTPQP